MRLFRKNHITASKIHINYVSKPCRPLFSSLYSRIILPSKMAGYDFSIKHGLRLKPRSNSWVTSSLLASSLLMALPLLWWLNSSEASIMPPAAKASTPFVTAVSQSDVHASNIAIKKISLPPKISLLKNCEKKLINTYTKTVAVHCVINTSLSAVAQRADLSNHLFDKFIELFQLDIDFERDIQAGEKISIIYNKQDGDILAAEFVSQGNVSRVVRYTNPAGYTDYYTPTGFHLQKISLLSAPLEYARISSRYGKRKHPILKKNSFHHGIDYAALKGTPIVAAGDATVNFIGRKGGYGKVIILKHHQRVKSLYAHLSKYAKGLRVGDEVLQGQVIGYVGQTGRATGPHLHYEIRFDRKSISPFSLADSSLSMPVTKKYRRHFLQNTQKLISELDSLNLLEPTKFAQSVQKPINTIKLKN